jgi:hypothetical protein
MEKLKTMTAKKKQDQIPLKSKLAALNGSFETSILGYFHRS